MSFTNINWFMISEPSTVLPEIKYCRKTGEELRVYLATAFERQSEGLGLLCCFVTVIGRSWEPAVIFCVPRVSSRVFQQHRVFFEKLDVG